VVVLITARDEAQRLPSTIAALRRALPGALILLADDGSRDATATLARDAGAIVVAARRRGKGQAASEGAARALELAGPAAVYVLCDADLGASAAALAELPAALRHARADVAIAAFSSPRDGFGLALRFARWSVRRHTAVRLAAPISGQRALSGRALQALSPFAPGFGMELAMTIAALRAGLRVAELPLALEHRRTGRGIAGFAHRGRQLAAFLAVHVAAGRRRPARYPGTP
jgi:glycosyltransferase involved in cell wall biosynthesis